MKPTFRADQEALDRLCRIQFGKTILFTDNADWTDEQIVPAYGSRYHIENAFKQRLFSLLGLRRRESTLVFWSFDTSNGQVRLIEGYVNDVNPAFLEIEPRNGDTIFVVIAGVDFVTLDRD